MWKLGWRDEVWRRLEQPWDVVIVGGGITGAGILAEAARLGLRVLLVEARDFAFGTSSRSTKLVHGGLRYLRQGQIRVTRESVRERERLLREAPGLVSPLGFYLTSFTNQRAQSWLFGAGLAAYDLIARKWNHERVNADAVIARVPELAGSSLVSAYHYFDAQTDDARLVVRVLREGVRHGGTVINYVRAAELLRDQRGRVVGVALVDEAGGGRTAEVKARVVINATGVWADELRAHVGAEKRLRPIRGSHLVFPSSRFPLTAAISLLHPRDGRVVFALPWEGVTLVGTTDVDHHASLSSEPAMAQSEAEYLFSAIGEVFPNVGLAPSDVIATFAGVRAVIDTGAKNPAKESREHALWQESGLLTVAGGKLTTFRLMARDTLRAIADDLGLADVGKTTQILDPATTDDADSRIPARWWGRYGAEATEVWAAAEGQLDPIGGSVATYGELRWAARSEGAQHLDDLLLRRTRVGLQLPEGGLAHADRIRASVQTELGWDDARWESELSRYREIWGTHYGTRFTG